MDSFLAQHVLSRGGKVISIAHTKELVESAYKTYDKCFPGAPYGVFSASLKRKESTHNITFASEKSLVNGLDQLPDRNECMPG